MAQSIISHEPGGGGMNHLVYLCTVLL